MQTTFVIFDAASRAGADSFDYTVHFYNETTAIYFVTPMNVLVLSVETICTRVTEFVPV